MHKKRYDIFYKELGWDVQIQNEMERDQYDTNSAIYIVSFDPEFGIVGGMRLLPTSGPTMIKEHFSHLIDSSLSIPCSHSTWEVTRFFYKHPNKNIDRIGLARKGTLELFIGMMEFALSWNLDALLVQTDLRIEKLLHNIGWKLR